MLSCRWRRRRGLVYQFVAVLTAYDTSHASPLRCWNHLSQRKASTAWIYSLVTPCSALPLISFT